MAAKETEGGLEDGDGRKSWFMALGMRNSNGSITARKGPEIAVGHGVRVGGIWGSGVVRRVAAQGIQLRGHPLSTFAAGGRGSKNRPILRLSLVKIFLPSYTTLHPSPMLSRGPRRDRIFVAFP